MKHLTFALVLMTLAACGGKNSSSKPTEEKFVRGLNCLQTPGALCLPKTRWFIYSRTEDFPKKISLSLNGSVSFNQCDGDSEDEVITTEKSAFSPDIAMKSFKTNGAFKKKQVMRLEIKDLGEDCRNDAIYYSADEIGIDPINHSEETDWFVSQSISVTLEN